MMNVINRYAISFLVFLISSSLFSTPDDLTLYRKIKIIDPKAEVEWIDECFFHDNGDIFLRGGSNLIRINKEGEVIASIVKSGFGPDEIARLASIDLNEKRDTFVLFDQEKNKITFFDLNGKYINIMDPPIKQRTIFLKSNNLGHYYLYFKAKKDECQIYHLDKDFKSSKCFYPKSRIDDQWLPWSFLCMDFDSKSNIYIVYPTEYLVNLFDKNGKFIKNFANPGEHYKKPEGQQPPPSNREKYNKWFKSMMPVLPIYILENKTLIVFYQSVTKNSPKYYDLYTLEGKRISSGTLDEGLWPIGKDQHGRLVCAKTDISSDGMDVTYWLYIYSLKSESRNGKQ